MKKYIFIALGGMLGAMLRYKIEHIHIYHYKEVVPINTLMINISGSFVLALILTIAFEIWQFSSDLRLGIATGFLGAYTTFSTMCKETVNLMKQGDYYSSISYIGFSTMLGLAAAYFGIILAREIISKLVKENDDYNEENLENVSGEDK
ncbi:fluoride efflux transporter CrcB [Clostridium drakei]|uniref:Fluoride-specific ion channel FluC n=1 Tax=Clostridium drakei TaxID=332101 RepID=A0A2U8DMD1_9CLOT|nr:fluoride efflux transporter CrcB [Clostridium drakei]AWI03342.1 chromosome condensation protein CrcB [Clostridium drakei]